MQRAPSYRRALLSFPARWASGRPIEFSYRNRICISSSRMPPHFIQGSCPFGRSPLQMSSPTSSMASQRELNSQARGFPIKSDAEGCLPLGVQRRVAGGWGVMVSVLYRRQRFGVVRVASKRRPKRRSSQRRPISGRQYLRGLARVGATVRRPLIRVVDGGVCHPWVRRQELLRLEDRLGEPQPFLATSQC
jgi:hypothetical protein